MKTIEPTCTSLIKQHHRKVLLSSKRIQSSRECGHDSSCSTRAHVSMRPAIFALARPLIIPERKERLLVVDRYGWIPFVERCDQTFGHIVVSAYKRIQRCNINPWEVKKCWIESFSFQHLSTWFNTYISTITQQGSQTCATLNSPVMDVVECLTKF